MKKGIFFVIIGPSGVGKGTILSEFKNKNKNKNIYYPVTSTTREPRYNEKHGKDYYFISKEKFIEGINNNEFLEYAIVHKLNYYGLPKKQIIDNLNKGINIVRELDIQGLFNLKKILPKRSNIFNFFCSSFFRCFRK
jgi:guanylate kinase